MKTASRPIIPALLFTLALLTIGYLAFGFWTTVIFTSGFLGGFLLWLGVPVKTDWSRLKLPYWLALGLFFALGRRETIRLFSDAGRADWRH